MDHLSHGFGSRESENLLFSFINLGLSKKVGQSRVFSFWWKECLGPMSPLSLLPGQILATCLLAHAPMHDVT